MEDGKRVGFIKLVLFLGIFVVCCIGQNTSDSISAVYIVTIKQTPVSHYYSEFRVQKGHHIKRNASERTRLDKPRYSLSDKVNSRYNSEKEFFSMSFIPCHTAATAAGNYGIPVVVAGHHFGNASGMAPRSQIAVYKALYKSFRGFAADVVAAIDQAAQDGVDISLSITPNRHPPGIATFFNPVDTVLLSAVKAGIFVIQAARNAEPSPKCKSSFSPWVFTVGVASHD